MTSVLSVTPAWSGDLPGAEPDISCLGWGECVGVLKTSFYGRSNLAYAGDIVESLSPVSESGAHYG